MFRSWFRQGAIPILGILLITTAACGPQAATPTEGTATPTVAPAVPSPTTAPPVATATPLPATATPLLPTATPSPEPPTATAAPPTATEPPASPTAVRDLAARPTATGEPEDCFRSVGVVISRVDQAYHHQPGDAATIAKDLQSACVDDRALAIWALGSIHDPAAIPALQAYVAASPDGDWRRDEYDLVPVAQAAIAYIQAPLDTTHTYMVRPRGLYGEMPKYDADGNLNLIPMQTIKAGEPLIRVQKIHPATCAPTTVARRRLSSSARNAPTTPRRTTWRSACTPSPSRATSSRSIWSRTPNLVKQRRANENRPPHGERVLLCRMGRA